MTDEDTTDRPGQEEQTGAILFADVVGSTPLYEDTGNWEALEMIGGALDRHRVLVEDNHGIVVRSKGDDLLCTFARGDDAVAAASLMLEEQRRETLQMRLGLHFGSYIAARGDIFGDAVNVAARLLGLALADEAIVSATLAEQLSESWRAKLTPFEQRRLKGKSDLTSLFRLLPSDDDATVFGQRTFMRLNKRPQPLEITLRAGDASVRVNENDPPLRIGRSDDADLRFADKRVSRAHATVTVRDGRATLTDRSSLGTWVFSQDSELLVRRETVHLVGEGRIGVGSHPAEDAPNILHYSVAARGSRG